MLVKGIFLELESEKIKVAADISDDDDVRGDDASRLHGDVLLFSAGGQKAVTHGFILNVSAFPAQASVSADVASASVETPVDER